MLVLGIGNSAMRHRRRDLAVVEHDLPGHAPRRLRDPQVLRRQPRDQLAPEWLISRLPLALAAPDVRAGRSRGEGPPRGLRAADAGPQARRGPPHGVVGPPTRASATGASRSSRTSSGSRATRVRFVDGSVEQIDRSSSAPGYRITLPVLRPRRDRPARGQRSQLYRRVVPPDLPGLYFIGLVQPLGAIMPMAELQSEWVADLLEGGATLPAPAEMTAEISREEQEMRERYVASEAPHDPGGFSPVHEAAGGRAAPRPLERERGPAAPTRARATHAVAIAHT